jgi:hypothetical protein
LSLGLSVGSISCSQPDEPTPTPPVKWPVAPPSPKQEAVVIPIIDGTAKYIGRTSLPAGANADKFWQNSAYAVTPISNTYDGNTEGATNGEIYHTPWDPETAGYFPVELAYTLDAEKADVMDGICLYPRSSGSGTNGMIYDVDVWVQCQGEEWTLMEETRDAAGVIDISFVPAITNPRKVKLVVTKSSGGWVSLAEVVCFKNSGNNSYDCFTDMTCSEVKPGLTLADLEKVEDIYLRNLAKKLWYAQNDQKPGPDEDPAIKPYDPVAEKHLFEVQAYPPPALSAESNKTSPYGRYDNATALHVKKDQNVVIFVDRTVGSMTAVVVNPKRPDFQHGDFVEQELMLRRGANHFKATGEGLIYIVCHTTDPDWKNLRTKIHIVDGTYNGKYVMGKSRPDEWAEMLDNAVFSHIDMMGDHSHLVMPVERLKTHAPDADYYIDTWEQMVYQQMVFSGFVKYNRVPPTRMTFIVGDIDSYMFAINFGYASLTGYNSRNWEDIFPAQKIRTTHVWGPAHEIGHVNQLRPALSWQHMGEVTNNIFSLYIQTTVFGNIAGILRREYNNAYRRFFGEGQLYTDPDVLNIYNDVMSRLVPLWQLYLYFSKAGYYKAAAPEDFYKDLMEALRTDPAYNGVTGDDVRFCMDRFVWHVSKVSRTNMVKFFNDYGFDVSPSVVSEIKAMGFPAPGLYMRYIDDANVELYKNPAPVVAGTATISGTAPDYSVSVQGSRNAVAFELYEGSDPTARPVWIDRLGNFSFTSSADKNTLIIKAVGVDGTRVDAVVR